MKLLTNITDRVIKFFYIFLIALILVIVPLKILSYGWNPNYAMLISATLTKDCSLPITQDSIEESIKSNKPLYHSEKERKLIIFITVTFIVFNLTGLCILKNPISWFASMIVLMLSNTSFITRIVDVSPQLWLSMLLITIISLFYSSICNNPKTGTLSILVYIFVLRSIIPPEVYFMDRFNYSIKYIWSLSSQEISSLLFVNTWLFYAAFLIWLSAYKKKISILREFNDSLLLSALILQLTINLGLNDLILFRDSLLLLWFSLKISEIIRLASCFNEFRVKHSFGFFVLLVFLLLATHDASGRFSKTAIENFPIDFSLKELREWAPGYGGIIYNDNVDFAFSQFYENPDANYSFIFFNTFSMFEKEKENLLNIKRFIEKDETPLPEYYEDWVEQMKPIDRLITTKRINGLENIDWLQCGRKLWIGRLKTYNEKDFCSND